MRLWNYNMLDVLPRQQLLSQLRECVAIAKDIYEKGTTNHILINPIMNYDLENFRIYCDMIIGEMGNRGYNVSDKTINKLGLYLNYEPNLPFVDKEYLDKVSKLFNGWHNERYLVQCIYNLEEKYDRGGITKEEWDKIYHKYYMYIDY